MKPDNKSAALNQGNSDQPKYQLTVRLPRDIFRRIESEAKDSGISLAEAVRRYINRGIRG